MLTKKKIYIWGTGQIEEAFSKKFLTEDLFVRNFWYIDGPIEGFIDSYRTGLHRGREILKVEDVDLQDSFVIVAVKNYKEIENYLKKQNLQYGSDYICLSKKITLQKVEDYFDCNNNHIIGKFKGETLKISECCDIHIGKNVLFGSNVKIFVREFSRLIIEDNCIIENDVMIQVDNSSSCTIGEESKILKGSRIYVCKESLAETSRKCVFPTTLYVTKKSNFKMGAESDFDVNTVVRVLNGSSVMIGKDCMFSYNIMIRGEDGHMLLDEAGAILNRSRDVYIGDHVWIGMGTIILPGTFVGSGSVAGAGSVINKQFKERVVVAGVPAKVIRENTTWDRRAQHG